MGAMVSSPARARLAALGALLACAPVARAVAAEPPAAPPRASLTLIAEGLRDRTRAGGDTAREAALGVRGRLPVLTRVGRDDEGRPSELGLALDAEARAVALDFPEADGVARFLRLGAGVSGAWAPSPRDSFRLQLGAFVAEQVALLGSAQVHPRAVFVGTHRAGDDLRLLYGLGYTYDFGRGLPIPLLGLVWRMAPRWRLDALLPVVVRATYAASDRFSVDFGTAVAGEQFRYRVATPAGAPEGPHEILHIARLRLGPGCGIALAPGARLAVAAGVEGSRIDSGLGTRTLVGVYVTAALRLGGHGAGEPFLER
jgi:hypothetical protein